MRLRSVLATAIVLFAWSVHSAVGWSQETQLPPVPEDTLADGIDLASVRKKLLKHDAVAADHPLTEERVALGRKLFFDPVLSKDGSVSCASCHQPNHGFASPDAKAIGIGGQVGRRNAPTLWNRALGKLHFWDGRAGTLEQQALQPIANPKEMGHSVKSVIQALRGDPEYVKQFASAFFGTDLAEWLRAEQADSLIVCGLTTSGCVRATVVDGLQHNFPVWVPEESVGDRNADAHRANLHDMHAKYAEVVTLAETLGHIEALPEVAA